MMMMMTIIFDDDYSGNSDYDNDDIDYHDDYDGDTDDSGEYCFRISRLERDLSQKRVLMDDIKLKLTVAQQHAESDADVMVLTICLLGVNSICYKFVLDVHRPISQATIAICSVRNVIKFLMFFVCPMHCIAALDRI